MFIFRMVRRLVLIICIVLGAIYAYDTYQSYQGSNRVSKAHTTVEQTIEENEDTLSRWERIHRMLIVLLVKPSRVVVLSHNN